MTSKPKKPAPAEPAAELSPSIRANKVGELIGLSRAQGYVYMSRPGFPRPRRISARFVVYDRGEILAWRDQHMAGDAR